jgi:hypothetical protein
VIGGAHDREPEIRLEALLVEVEGNKPPADPMRDQGAESGIDHRDPDQISWESEIASEQRQWRGRRQAPEDVRERGQRHQAPEQAGAELVRALDEEIDVVGDAQMNVVDGVVDEPNAVMPALRHPERDVVFRHPAAPANLQRLPEIVLRHPGHDRAQRNRTEHDQLARERVPVARLERVEESCVPGNDRDRDIDEPELRRDHARQQQARRPAVFRAEIGQRERTKLPHGRHDAAHSTSVTRPANGRGVTHPCRPAGAGRSGRCHSWHHGDGRSSISGGQVSAAGRPRGRRRSAVPEAAGRCLRRSNSAAVQQRAH